MSKELLSRPLHRRTVLKAGLAIGAIQVASPFVVKSLADEPFKIGLDNPLTGTYAALGKNELIGAQLALDQINAKGGILGRKVELLVEDFDQRRRRHGGAESQQADRPRQGQLPDRQHQFGAGAGYGERQPSRKACSTSFLAAIPTASPARNATGTSSASATRRAWRPTRCRSCCSSIRQEVVLHHHRLCVRSWAAGRLRGEPEGRQRHRARRRLHAARHRPTSRPI